MNNRENGAWMVYTQEDGSDKVVSLVSASAPVSPRMSYDFYDADQAVVEVRSLVAQGYHPTGQLTRQAVNGIAPE